MRFFPNLEREKPQYTVEEAIADAKIPWTKNKGYAIDMLRHGTGEEITALTNAVVSENEPDVKANMLRLFTRGVPFSGDIEELIEFTKSANKNLSLAAFEAISEIKSDKAREYALALLDRQEYVCEAVSILCKNYRKSDADIISSAVKKIKLRGDRWHRAFSDVAGLIEKNRDAPKELLG